MLPTKRICRVRIAKEELEKMSKDDFHKSWLLQEQYVDFIESKLNDSSEHMELVSLRESEEKLKQQQLEATRRENILVMRLTTKEQEMQEYAGQIQELKQAQIPSVAQLRSALLDPAVNLMFERMRKEMDSLKARLKETQNELSAWKFTPDSNTGKRLMAKCRLLYQENEELGKMISSGRMAKLEGDLALQKSFSEEMKKSQSELDEFLLELDEDVEGMQSTIYYLQQQLRESKEQILKLQKEKQKLSGLPPQNSPTNNHVAVDENTDGESEVPIGFVAPVAEITSKVHSKQPVLSTISDLNRTEGMSNPKPDKGNNTGRPWSPPPYDDKKPDPHLTVVSVKEEPTEEVDNAEAVDSGEQLVQHTDKPPKGSTVKEVGPIEKITNSLSPVSITAVRGSLHMEEYDSEQETDAIKTVGETGSTEMIVAESCEEPEKQDAKLSNKKPATDILNKRTSENGNKSRKRTRSSRVPTEQCTNEEENPRDLPTVKRLRRRDIVVTPDVLEEDQKRTALEIDTDTEVQVAQTLALWAAAKQERKEVCINSQDLVSESLGNGELKGNKKTSEGKV